MQDAFVWRAHYNDGTHLDEMKDDGSGQTHGFAAVNQPRLVAFELIPLAPGLPAPTVSVPPEDPDFRVIFFRRREITISLASGEETAPRGTKHVLGFQRTVRGKNVKFLTVYFGDGSVLVTDDDEAF